MSGSVEMSSNLRHRQRSGATPNFTNTHAGRALSGNVTTQSACALQIVKINSDHTFELDQQTLEMILRSDAVKNRKVVVVSIAGAMRMGKSTLLNFILRYFANKGPEGEEDWMGQDDEPLSGFSWSRGVDRNTSGIQMWSDPFIVTLPSTGEQVAVLLMDTQGTFDHEATLKDCAVIFGLSTIISSLQFYNLSKHLQEDKLQNLHLFTEVGRLVMIEREGIRPFQSLCFLIRDWECPYEYTYGQNGGQEYLDKVLTESSNQAIELRMVRKHIRKCFDHVSCFLLPHPGNKVVRRREFDGRLSDLDDEFKTHVKNLVHAYISPQNLLVKLSSDNEPFTGETLCDCIKIYMAAFQSDDLPPIMTAVKALAQCNNHLLVLKLVEQYSKEMEQVCHPGYIQPTTLKSEHCRIKRQSIEHFNEKSMGSEADKRSFMEMLICKLDDKYTLFCQSNKKKRPILLREIVIPIIAAAIGAALGNMAPGPVVIGGAIGALIGRWLTI